MGRRARPKVKLEPTYFREWRKFRKMNQVEVGLKIGLDSSAVGKLERGVTPYDQIHLQTLSKLYNVPIPDLLYTDPRRDNQAQKVARKVALLSDAKDLETVMSIVDAFLTKR
jgi:transcriptional regulator with XRE-family HTH domain